jgi:hypothetical protein
MILTIGAGSLLSAFRSLTRRDWLTLAFAALSSALPIALHALWRHRYYGEWMPNTYLLKVSGHSLEQKLANGSGFVSLFLDQYGVALVAAAAGLLLVQKFDAISRVILLGMGVALGYQVYVGGDPWVHWRQLAPALVLLCVLFGVLLARAAGWLLGVGVSKRRVLLTISCAVAVLAATNLRFAWELLRFKPYASDKHRADIRTGLALRRVLNEKGRVMSFRAGTVPYYFGGYAIDQLGKTDRHIALLPAKSTPAWDRMRGPPGHNKYDLKWSIITMRPDYIPLWAWGDQNLKDYVSQNFVSVEHADMRFCLRKDSAGVNWENVKIVGGCVTGKHDDES